MTIRERIEDRFLDRLLSTPEGRAHMLAQAEEGESNGEGQVFQRALAKVDDPEIARLIKRHQEDEIRHTKMFHQCVERQGVGAVEVPEELRLIDRLDRALGGVIDRPIETREDVMHMYLILQVIEERAITQFNIIEPVLRRHDAKSADTMKAIARDEERHLRYCHAIARQFAPDDVTREKALARYRLVEGDVFARQNEANLRYTLDEELAGFGPVESWLWRGLAALLTTAKRATPTPYWRLAPAAS